jgi:DNA-binding NarL/FixJ family response regulator
MTPEAGRKSPGDADEPPHGQRVRVLLVDDHLVMRQGMAAIINEEPDMIVCGQADGVRSAIAAAAESSPHVALVDLSIRDGDGLELLREMRQRFPEVRALVLSMFDETVYAQRALRAGASGYIMKAEAAKTVMAGIRAVLRGETFLSAQMAGRLTGNEHRKADVPAALVGRLSDRELQVLRCIGRGHSTREIAEELFISVKTVEAHREHVKAKLGLVSSGELLRYAIEHNRLNE